MAPRFEHDERKEAVNLRKHGVTFDEAQTTFLDIHALSGSDDEHSTPGDERYINLGMSTKNRLLFVVHNEDDGLIRIITARVASRTQRDLYENS